MITGTGAWNLPVSNMAKFHKDDTPLSEAFIQLIKDKQINKVYDFGCGDGFYVTEFGKQGIHAKGFDGNPNTKYIPNCFVQDLTDPTFQIEPVYYVQCLEVAEHIPKQYEATLLDTLTKHVLKGGILVLSWAIKGQPGHGHVNCQNNDYVIESLKERGFLYNSDISLKLRAVSTLRWFKNTIMVFEKL